MTQQVPAWVRDAVFYQIFPERYANGDASIDPAGVQPWGGTPTRENFFGGDLRGIIDHLDHISDLGATAIYLTPIFAADTNHRYDCTDYERIDPHLGDLDTFRELIRAAHSRGIRIVLDAVFNHCGIGHWAFRDVVARGARSPYVNWFYVEDLPVVVDPERFNYTTCGGAHYLPKWNVHNPQVREHLFDVTRRWTAEGIDGWRLDVPYFMNQNFWRRFRELVKGIDKDLYIVAECWETATEWVRGDTADAAMNYPLRDLILGLVADRALSPAQFADGLRALWAALPDAAVPGMLNLLGSHDTERLLTRCQGDIARVRQALALLVTSPGVPMLYYGDEVGMTGENDPGCRGCMPWDTTAWDRAILETTQALLRLRRTQPALVDGADEVLHADEALLVRRRGLGPDCVVVAVNVGDGPRRLPAVVDGFEILYSSGGSGDRAEVPAGGVLVLGRAATVTVTEPAR